MEKRFEETFSQIKVAFSEVFHQLFGGGHAELKLTNPDDLLETGVEIKASFSPPDNNLPHRKPFKNILAILQ